MRAHTVVARAAAIALTCLSCSREGKAPDAAPTSQVGFDSAATRLLTALRTDAMDSALALMASDVVLMPPHEPVLNGAEAVRAWYQGLLTQLRTASMVVSNREVRMGGEWVTELAGFEWTLTPVAGGANVVERGNYFQLWHREPDGRYLLTREIWNSAAPVTPPAGN